MLLTRSESSSSLKNLRRKFLLWLVPLLVLSGCNYDLPPVDAGSFELFAPDKATKGELAPSQVEGLLDWLRSHRTNWEFKIEDRAPELWVHLKQKGATVAVVEIGQNSMGVKNYVRKLTPDERAYLAVLLTSFPPPK